MTEIQAADVSSQITEADTMLDDGEGFDLTSFPSLTPLHLKAAAKKPEFWYFYNTETNTYCRFFIVSSGKTVSKRVCITFIQKPGSDKLVPQIKAFIIVAPFVKTGIGLI